MRTRDDEPGIGWDGGSGGADDLIGRKAALRDAVRPRDAAFAAVRADASAAIVDHLVGSVVWRGAKRAMAYLAMRTEVDLDPLWDRSPRPIIGVPRVEAGSEVMTVVEMDDPSAESEPGPFGVRAARDGAKGIEPGSLNLVLVPGMAFDIAGNRLGRGGGFYDRFLAGLDPSRTAFVGVCWSGRVVASVPVGPSDVRVRMLLTEHGLERCRG